MASVSSGGRIRYRGGRFWPVCRQRWPSGRRNGFLRARKAIRFPDFRAGAAVGCQEKPAGDDPTDLLNRLTARAFSNCMPPALLQTLFAALEAPLSAVPASLPSGGVPFNRRILVKISGISSTFRKEPMIVLRVSGPHPRFVVRGRCRISEVLNRHGVGDPPFDRINRERAAVSIKLASIRQ